LNVKLRHYTDQPGFTEDFIKVRDFLMRIHEPGHTDRNWLWARWEYMFSHPNLDETNLSRIGLWEDEGKLIALATYEDNIGATYFSLDSAYSYLKAEMLEYAIEYLSCASEDGAKSLRAVISDDDAEMREIAVKHGFTLTERRDPISEFRVSGPFPDIALPDGFSIVSLAEENDLYKIERVLWRGFNHPGEPPSDYIPGRLKMQSGPSFRRDLTVVVKAPSGDFVSFCGMWYDRNTDYAYVEPVATDPDHRRMGLGKAAVLEGIKRCFAEGAEVAYVGSTQPFYLNIGFKPLFVGHWWEWQTSVSS
jgi:GNAT superfamily N-acetyltransferase